MQTSALLLDSLHDRNYIIIDSYSLFSKDGTVVTLRNTVVSDISDSVSPPGDNNNNNNARRMSVYGNINAYIFSHVYRQRTATVAEIQGATLMTTPYLVRAVSAFRDGSNKTTLMTPGRRQYIPTHTRDCPVVRTNSFGKRNV